MVPPGLSGDERQPMPAPVRSQTNVEGFDEGVLSRKHLDIVDGYCFGDPVDLDRLCMGNAAARRPRFALTMRPLSTIIVLLSDGEKCCVSRACYATGNP